MGKESTGGDNDDDYDDEDDDHIGNNDHDNDINAWLFSGHQEGEVRKGSTGDDGHDGDGLEMINQLEIDNFKWNVFFLAVHLLFTAFSGW